MSFLPVIPWSDRYYPLAGRPIHLTTATAAAVAAFACLSASYLYIRPALQFRNKPTPTLVARSRARARSRSAGAHPSVTSAYPPDVFPGARDVETPYGTIKVFEWGPEDGPKVLLMHGIGTPSVALGDMAKRFVSKGCRVMLFDFFGRGYSDAPADLPYDTRLYTTQLLLVLASSPLPWTGSSSFHILGYSLGGAVAAAFAAYFPHMLRSATLICPGGLIRPHHVSLRNRLLYSEGLLPEWLIRRMIRKRLEPKKGEPSADVPVDNLNNDADEEGEDDDEYGTHAASLDFDEVPLSRDSSSPRVKDAMLAQLEGNDGLVTAYISTIRHAPVYGQHDDIWKRLGERLAERELPTDDAPEGLPWGRICLVLAENDPVVNKAEWIQDSMEVLGEGAVDIHVVPGGHEIAISKGPLVADLAMSSWQC